jgi:hypothetical protein
MGYSVDGTSTASTTQTATVVHHAPGSEVVAQNVADHLSPEAQLLEDPTLAADEVVVVTGKDFVTVTDDGEPVSTNGTARSSGTTTSIPSELEYTEPVGIVPEGDDVC